MNDEREGWTVWVRHAPDARERALVAGVAVGAALGVGAVTWYLARMLVARERIDPLERKTLDAVGEGRSGPGGA